ncbi:hypothetical protein L6452_33688 [Arctium lappa]|uniref:Uncharacterized protein n=1 Tax=Arctium lappa TaxID=4217 RepID=A0ACB8YFE6_ARCLA|nr:hypothetical protein L6452_33688 [Arctium lappa]
MLLSIHFMHVLCEQVDCSSPTHVSVILILGGPIDFYVYEFGSIQRKFETGFCNGWILSAKVVNCLQIPYSFHSNFMTTNIPQTSYNRCFYY